MQTAEAKPCKKVQLEVHSGDAPVLKQKGMEFFRAIQGKTIQKDDRIVFGDMLMWVKTTKPDGPVQVSQKTAIKMNISEEPIVLSCPNCGKVQSEPAEVCANCGSQLPVESV